MGKPRKEWIKNEQGRYIDPNAVHGVSGPDETSVDGERGGGSTLDIEPILTRSGKRHKQFTSVCRVTDSSHLPEGKLKQISTTRWTEEYAYEIANKMLEYADNTEVPILGDFLTKHNLHPQQFARMRERHFFVEDAVSYFKQAQESKLCRHGLKRGNNPTMAIFMLKNYHKFRDKQPDEVPNTTVNMFSMPELVKRIIDKVEGRRPVEEAKDGQDVSGRQNGVGYDDAQPVHPLVERPLVQPSGQNGKQDL